MNGALRMAVYAAGAVAFGVLLAAMGLGLSGGGHGANSFLWVAVSALIFTPIAGASIPYAHRAGGRATFLAAMSLHYLLSGATLWWSEDGPYMQHLWAVAGWLVMTYLMTYLAGQAILWGAFASRARHARAV